MTSLKSCDFSVVCPSMKLSTVQIMMTMNTSTVVARNVRLVRTRLRRKFLSMSSTNRGR